KRIRAVSAEAMALLRGFAWPGNVRQLENAVFRAVVLAESDEIGLAEFPQIASQTARQMAAAGVVPLDSVLPVTLAAGDTPLLVEPAPTSNLVDHPPAEASAAGTLTLLTDEGEVRPLEAIEADVLRFAIAHYRGQMSEVA